MSKKAFLRLCCFIVLMVGLSLLAAAQTTPKSAAETVTIPVGSPIEIAAATCNSWPTVQDLYDAIQLATGASPPTRALCG